MICVGFFISTFPIFNYYHDVYVHIPVTEYQIYQGFVGWEFFNHRGNKDSSYAQVAVFNERFQFVSVIFYTLLCLSQLLYICLTMCKTKYIYIYFR